MLSKKPNGAEGSSDAGNSEKPLHSKVSDFFTADPDEASKYFMLKIKAKDDRVKEHLF